MSEFELDLSPEAILDALDSGQLDGLDRTEKLALRLNLHQAINDRDHPDEEQDEAEDAQVDAVIERWEQEQAETARLAAAERGRRGLFAAERSTLTPATHEDRVARIASFLTGDVEVVAQGELSEDDA